MMMIGNPSSYGGCSSSVTTKKYIRWSGPFLVAATLSVQGLGTGGSITIDHFQNMMEASRYGVPGVQYRDSTQTVSGSADPVSLKTDKEALDHIRSVLKPSISELASTFGVSRQTIYNWFNEEPVSVENSGRIQALLRAVEIIEESGIALEASLTRRKLFDGESLLGVVRSGGSVTEAATKLVEIRQREEKQRREVAARFASRKGETSADFRFARPDHPFVLPDSGEEV